VTAARVAQVVRAAWRRSGSASASIEPLIPLLKDGLGGAARFADAAAVAYCSGAVQRLIVGYDALNWRWFRATERWCVWGRWW
jgi:hypothetical protein